MGKPGLIKIPKKMECVFKVVANYIDKDGKKKVLKRLESFDIDTGSRLVNNKGNLADEDMIDPISQGCTNRADFKNCVFESIKYEGTKLEPSQLKKCNNFIEMMQKLGFPEDITKVPKSEFPKVTLKVTFK